MPPYFSLTFELKKSPTVIEDFYNAITKTDLKLINCDNDYSLDAAIATNQAKLNDDFVLGYEEDFTNDYISLYFEHPDFSYISLHICNIQNLDIVCFNLIIPEDDFLLYESAALNVTEIISNAKPPKRLYGKMNIIKELAIKMWNAVPTVLIQTSWELSDDLVLSNDIDDNCIPLIEPFCIIPESLVKASWGLKGTKLTNNSILIEENENWNNVFCDVDEWIECE